jgi:hypothetical protein
MLSDPTKDVTQRIVGAANYLTAAICSATDNKPASVCDSDPIPDIRNTLPKTAITATTATLPLIESCPGASFDCRRRENTFL